MLAAASGMSEGGVGALIKHQTLKMHTQASFVTVSIMTTLHFLNTQGMLAKNILNYNILS